MDQRTTEITIKACLREMRERLEQAASIATCADSGNPGKAIEIALDLEQLIYEVNTLLNAASMFKRIGKS